MARGAVQKRSLLKLEGVDEALKQIAATLDRTKGMKVKAAFVEGAKAIYGQVHRNIKSLPISDVMKEILGAQVAINQALPKNPYVIVGMSQKLGIKRIGSKHFVSNPYWYEFGTTKGIPARPYFRPAVTAARAIVKRRLADGLKAIITKPQ